MSVIDKARGWVEKAKDAWAWLDAHPKTRIVVEFALVGVIGFFVGLSVH
jgi:hypothetical protein